MGDADVLLNACRSDNTGESPEYTRQLSEPVSSRTMPVIPSDAFT
jgi:hypothetical protein